MSLDQNAGKKRTVGIARNLTTILQEPIDRTLTVANALKQVEAPEGSPKPMPESTPKVAAFSEVTSKNYATVTTNNRTKKISFLADPKLEERFKKARLRAGFDKLEDAYSEALKVFCEQVELGKIDRF